MGIGYGRGHEIAHMFTCIYAFMYDVNESHIMSIYKLMCTHAHIYKNGTKINIYCS